MELFVFLANSKRFTNWEIHHGCAVVVYPLCVCTEGDCGRLCKHMVICTFYCVTHDCMFYRNSVYPSTGRDLQISLNVM